MVRVWITHDRLTELVFRLEGTLPPRRTLMDRVFKRRPREVRWSPIMEFNSLDAAQAHIAVMRDRLRGPRVVWTEDESDD